MPSCTFTSSSPRIPCQVVAGLAGVGALVVLNACFRAPVLTVWGSLVRATYGRVIANRAATSKRAQVAAQISEVKAWLASPNAPQLTDQMRSDILGATAAELVRKQQQGAVTAVQILAAYYEAAIDAQHKTNCLTHLCVEAIAEARAADARRESGEPLGELHGCPVSIKDNIAVRGTDATLGMVRWVNQPTDYDAGVVQLIRRAGGVIIAKTNVPQTLVAYESTNYVFGTACNAHNVDFTAGGSSGGEGSLVAQRGSVIGIGTDIGGSIRIPAHFNGVYGVKCTQWRVPTAGIRTPMPGQEAVPSICGPLTRSMEDMITCLRVLLADSQSVDGNTAALPFRTDVYQAAADQKTLTFGYYADDGIAPASPACTRAVAEAVRALEAAGHRCVPVTPTWLGQEAAELFYALMASDNAATLRNALGSEPLIAPIGNTLKLVALPRWLRSVAAWYIESVKRDPLFAAMLRNVQQSDVSRYWKLQQRRQDLRRRLADEMRRHGLDAIVCPGLATPAVKLGESANATFAAMYTALLNLVDAPSAVVPVTRVDPSRDAWTGAITRAGVIEAKLRAMYDENAAAGLPVAVQVYGTKMSDERVLGCAAALDRALRCSQ